MKCSLCKGNGYIDNCFLTEEEHRKLSAKGENPCDDCQDIGKCNVGDFVKCTSCDGTGEQKEQQKCNY